MLCKSPDRLIHTVKLPEFGNLVLPGDVKRKWHCRFGQYSCISVTRMRGDLNPFGGAGREATLVTGGSSTRSFSCLFLFCNDGFFCCQQNYFIPREELKFLFTLSFSRTLAHMEPESCWVRQVMDRSFDRSHRPITGEGEIKNSIKWTTCLFLMPNLLGKTFPTMITVISTVVCPARYPRKRAGS